MKSSDSCPAPAPAPRGLTRAPPRKGRLHPEWSGKARGPNGRGLCRLCLAEVPKRRRSWCSDACVARYAEEADQGAIRRGAERRDRGLCALCGLDAGLLGRVLERLRAWANEEPEEGDRHRALQGARRILAELGWSQTGAAASAPWVVSWRSRRVWASGAPLWEADHARPLAEGGAFGLANVRTCCVPCHRRETAALAGRLAAVRRIARLRLPNGALPLGPGGAHA